MRNKETVGLTIGVWDGMHIGHVKLLQRASYLCDLLYVGVVCDKAVKRVKGNDRPKHSEKERLEIVKAIKGVTNAYLINDFDSNLLSKQIDPYLLYDSNAIFIYGEDQTHIRKIESKIYTTVYLERTPGVSTTDLHFPKPRLEQRTF